MDPKYYEAKLLEPDNSFKLSSALSLRLAQFVGQLFAGQLSHPLLVARELHALLEMAWEDAEVSLGERLR